MTTRADADVADNKAVHASNKIKNFSLWLSETNEAVEDSRDRAGQNGIHRYLLWDHIHCKTHLVLSEWHVNENVSNKDE